MTTRMLFLLITLSTMIGVITGCTPRPSAEPPSPSDLGSIFELDELVIVSDDGKRHAFDVYLALDYEQQRRGLMFVRDLPESTGMLFVYEREGARSMWMKNTYIPLDIVFARSDGSVSSVIHDTEPLSESPLGAVEPVKYVLELNAGVTRRLSIGTGSRLIWQR